MIRDSIPIGQAFGKSVEHYDAWVKIALPDYNDIFSIAMELIPFDCEEHIKVLDLGAGTGLFSWHVLSRYPKGTFVLVDVSEKMLKAAKIRFQAYSEQFQYRVDDYRNIQDSASCDLVISSLSIHHLLDDEKWGLFRRIYTLLKPSGLFINIDQIRGETPAVEELYWKTWLKQIREKGATEEQIQASIERRKAYDKDALLIEQLNWLKEAGFDDVDCVYKNYFIGVFMAVKK